MNLRKSSGKMCTPDGQGQQLCVAFDDYIKYKYTRTDLCWTENHKILIFPECIRKFKITED